MHRSINNEKWFNFVAYCCRRVPLSGSLHLADLQLFLLNKRWLNANVYPHFACSLALMSVPKQCHHLFKPKLYARCENEYWNLLWTHMHTIRQVSFYCVNQIKCRTESSEKIKAKSYNWELLPRKAIHISELMVNVSDSKERAAYMLPS